MPLLSDKRQEMYARARAKGMVPAKAAVAAGYATGSSIYAKLEEDKEVISRIVELQEEFELKKEQQRAAARASGEHIGKLTGIGRAWVLRELAENAAMARHEGKYMESNASLKMIGEELGMWKGTGDDEKNANGMPEALDFNTLESLTDAAHDAINPPLPDPLTDSEETDLEMRERERAARLIEGSTNRKKIEPLDLDSETTVAMTPDAIPDPEEGLDPGDGEEPDSKDDNEEDDTKQ